MDTGLHNIIGLSSVLINTREHSLDCLFCRVNTWIYWLNEGASRSRLKLLTLLEIFLFEHLSVPGFKPKRTH